MAEEMATILLESCGGLSAARAEDIPSTLQHDLALLRVAVDREPLSQLGAASLTEIRAGMPVLLSGYARAKAKIGQQNLAYNIRRLVTLERMAAA